MRDDTDPHSTKLMVQMDADLLEPVRAVRGARLPRPRGVLTANPPAKSLGLKTRTWTRLRCLSPSA